MADVTYVGFDGTIDEYSWAYLVKYLGAEYSVGGAEDLAVAVVPGQDRTVSINFGQCYNHGVTATFGTASTLQLPIVASGSRWFLVAMRFDWQPPGGTVTPVYVAGTADRAVPAGRLKFAGVQDDMPVALVQVTAGKQVPTAVVDLRVWAGNGGISAWDPLALAFLGRLGSRVLIGPDEWIYDLDAVDNPVWTSARLSRPMVRAWTTQRSTASGNSDSYDAKSGVVSLVTQTTQSAPPGWYTIHPQLSISAQSGSSVGYLYVRVGSATYRCRADLDASARTFTPTFPHKHTGGDLTVDVAHSVAAGVAVIDNTVSSLTTVFVGP